MSLRSFSKIFNFKIPFSSTYILQNIKFNLECKWCFIPFFVEQSVLIGCQINIIYRPTAWLKGSLRKPSGPYQSNRHERRGLTYNILPLDNRECFFNQRFELSRCPLHSQFSQEHVCPSSLSPTNKNLFAMIRFKLINIKGWFPKSSQL